MNDKFIHFKKASATHETTIMNWLSLPHIQEFWDNSSEHKEDILNFIHGRKQHYFYGTTQYWVGFIDDAPFAFLLSDQIHSSQTDLSVVHRENLSYKGHSISLDFGIGNIKHLGKGLAAPVLKKFMAFYRQEVNPQADTFFIDPAENNSRALHVYKKAGFKLIGDYIAKEGGFVDHNMHLLVKKFL